MTRTQLSPVTAARHPGGSVLPPGWRENPSSWAQRIPIVVLALVGTSIAAYLAAFQLEVVDDVWEPFFGDGAGGS